MDKVMIMAGRRNWYWLMALGITVFLSIINLPTVNAQEDGRVALVVQFNDSSLYTSCVDIGGREMSGHDLLKLAGYDLSVYYDANQGVAVCKIGNQGCDENHCFCQFPEYWSYWYTEDDGWVYSEHGASNHVVRAGTVEGWLWGIGDRPPAFTYEQICSVSQAHIVSDTAPGWTGLPSNLATEVSGPVQMAGMLSELDEDRQQADESRSKLANIFGSVGYPVFGSALLAMGFGLVVLVYRRR